MNENMVKMSTPLTKSLQFIERGLMSRESTVSSLSLVRRVEDLVRELVAQECKVLVICGCLCDDLLTNGSSVR